MLEENKKSIFNSKAYKELVKQKLKALEANLGLNLSKSKEGVVPVDTELLDVKEEDIKDIKAVVPYKFDREAWEAKWKKEQEEKDKQYEFKRKEREKEEAEHKEKEQKLVEASWVLTEEEVENLKKRQPKAQFFVNYILKNCTKVEGGYKLGKVLTDDKQCLEAIEDMIGRDFYTAKYFYSSSWKGYEHQSSLSSGLKSNKWSWGSGHDDYWDAWEGRRHGSDYYFPKKEKYSSKAQEQALSTTEDLGKTILDLAKKGRYRELKAISDNSDISEFSTKDINYRDAEGRTALMWAAATNRQEILELLLAMGASPNVKDNAGNTPLSKACSRNNNRTAKALLDYDADPNFDTGSECPLIMAIKNKNIKLVQQLLMFEADPNKEIVENGILVDPLWIAVARQNVDMVDSLLSFKALPYKDLFSLSMPDKMLETFEAHGYKKEDYIKSTEQKETSKLVN